MSPCKGINIIWWILTSNDNLIFYLNIKVAEQSEYLKKRIEGENKPKIIKLQEIRGEILDIVVDHLNQKVK